MAVQEVNASEIECIHFRRTLKQQGKYFSWGATRQGTSEVTGDRGGGCAFISKKPLVATSSLPDLNPEEKTRIHIQIVPLRGGAACYVISAYFWDSSHKNFRDKTNSLLEKITEWSYCMGKVPIYLMADFNQEV